MFWKLSIVTISIAFSCMAEQSTPSRSIRTASDIHVLENEVGNSDPSQLVIFGIENTLITYDRDFSAQIVNNSLPAMLEYLLELGIKAVAISDKSETQKIAHSEKSAHETYLEELGSVDIDLSTFFPETTEGIDIGHNITIHNGIIYAGNNSKTKAIKHFVEKFELSPHKIIFVDNNIRDHFILLEEMIRTETSFVGLFYTEAKPFYSKLHLAAKDNNLVQAIYLINHGVSANDVTSLGDKPLHLAARFGNIEMVKFLMNNGAVDTVDNDGKTALELAAENGHEEVVRELAGSLESHNP